MVLCQASKILNMDSQTDIRTPRDFQKYLGRVTMRKKQTVMERIRASKLKAFV